MITSLLTKFGAPKILIGVFAAGLLFGGIPTAFAVHSLWNGAAKNKTIRNLKAAKNKQELTIELQRSREASDALIIKSKTALIDALEKSNGNLVQRNIELAASRPSTTERIIERGIQIKERVGEKDKCAIADTSDELREYGNGSDYNAASLLTGTAFR